MIRSFPLLPIVGARHGWLRGMTAVLLLCLLAVVTSCRQHRRYVIGVSQCSEDIWRDKLNVELQMATYHYDNVTLKILSAQDDDQLQMKQIAQLAEEGIDLLIVSPNQVNTITPVIDSVYDAGIPVILFDRKTNSDKYTSFIGADNVAAGRAMADFIITQLHGQGTVLEIAGLEGSSPAIERHQGFTKALADHPGMTLVEQRYAGWLEQKATKQMDQFLASHAAPDFVFAQNDRMAIGAIESARRHGARQTQFVGIDALAVQGGGLERVADGTLAASYIYPTRGDLVMQLAMNILGHKPYQQENYLKGALVTKDNARLLLMQNEELDKQRSRLEALHFQVDTYLAQYNHQKLYLLLMGVIVVLLIALVVYVYRSILVRRRLEWAATQAKLQFFTSVSHDLRTPLTLIATPIDHLLADTSLTTEQRGMLQMAHRNIGVLHRMVSEILDFRKTQLGKMTLHATTFDLSARLRQWAEPFGATAHERSVQLTIDVPASLLIVADVNKVERICYNLLSNAVKYTPAGGTIAVRAEAIEGGVRLSVTNTGSTIAPDVLPHIFERFYQAPDSQQGTGIGLSLVQSFTEMHGGRATAESHDGTTTFSCTLMGQGTPDLLAPAADDSTREAASAAPLPNVAHRLMTQRLTSDTPGELPTLLIVDDNADMRSVVASMMGATYRVLQAADGAEGLRQARLEVPDVVVSDVMMPVMDGLEFCRQLKADPLTCHIPVLLLTARTEEGQRADGYDCGADAYLTKPFGEDVLRSRVRNLLANRRLLKNIFASDEPKAAAEKPAGSAESQFADKFRAIVQEHMGDTQFNIEVVCQEMGISRAQLYRKVKAITGQAPLDIIREARLRRAERLLQTTDRGVAEIAYEVGFSSPSYFSKCYREFFGHTPKKANG